MQLNQWMKPIVERLVTTGVLFVRPMTVGVRVMAFDPAGRLFLVRHTYLPGWYLPGGGVDPGETVAEAARRELVEEGGLVAEEEPRLVGVYLNRRVSRRDHVILFALDRFTVTEPSGVPNAEIAEAGFFALDALPSDTTAGTLRRIAERAGGPRDAYW
jgi:8-oxo-dGTP pyrophosphatase MutT (NUDIX family)